MTKKELEKAKSIFLMIASLEAELLDFRNILQTAPITPYNQMPGGTKENTSRIENGIMKIEQYTEKIWDRISEYTEESEKITNAIENLENYNERLILRLRYINKKSFKEIGEVMHLTRNPVFELHERAINNLLAQN